MNVDDHTGPTETATAASTAASAAGQPAYEFRSRPCDGVRRCPWRTDADLTVFTEQDMARLQRTERGVRAADATLADDMAAVEVPAMSCHKDQPDSAHPMRLCAGWLAVVGPHHVPTQMSLISGMLPTEAVYPDTHDWPDLHASLAHLLARRQEQLAARDRAGAPRCR